MVDEHAHYAILFLQAPVHDQDRLQVCDLPVPLVDRRPQDDVDVAELVGQREELELLAGRWRLPRDHQTADSHLRAVADARPDRLRVDHVQCIELGPVEMNEVVGGRQRE